MSQTGKDWLGNAAGGMVGLAIVICVAAFALDRCKAMIAPVQYAEAAAARQAERDAATARQTEQQQASNAEQARRDEAERRDALTYQLASDAFANFKSSLRDPQAGRFRDVWAVKGELSGVEIVAACGVVNAPNAFGAYVGETPFIAAASRIYTPGHPSFESIFRAICLGGQKVLKLR